MMEMRGVRGLVAPALVGLALAACGGGGGDEAAPAEGGAPAAGAVTENRWTRRPRATSTAR
jgi:hypothetical protein